MNDGRLVPIDPATVRWHILADPKPAEDGVDVELSWGWTAGMTEAELAELADDAPRGHESVMTTLGDAVALRDALTVIIDGYREEDARRRAEFDRQYKELYDRLFPGGLR